MNTDGPTNTAWPDKGVTYDSIDLEWTRSNVPGQIPVAPKLDPQRFSNY